MKCPTCGYDAPAEALHCDLCSELLTTKRPQSREPEKPKNTLPARVVEKLKREEEEREDAQDTRRRALLKGYAATGALTLAILSILTGLPGSLHPIRLVATVVVSLIFGLPLGYVIGKAGGGVLKGALISALFFLLVQVVISVPGMISGTVTGSILLMFLPYSLFVGSIPGIIIGWTITNSN